MKKLIAVTLSILLICALFAGCGSIGYDSAKNSASSPESSYVDNGYASDDYEYDAGAATEEAKSENSSSGLLSSAPTGEHDPSEKIVYTADTRIETTDFDAAIQSAYDVISAAEGYIQDSYISGRSYERIYRGSTAYRNANFTVRVPSGNFKSFTDSLSDIGNVLYVNYSQDNITTQYYNVQTRLEAYNAEHARLVEMMQKAETVEDMLSVEQRLSEVEYQIDSLTTSLNSMQKDVDYSTVTIELQEVEILTEQEETHQTYWQRTGSGFMDTLTGIGDFFKDLFQLFIIAIPLLVLLGIIALVIILLVRRSRKKKKARRQSAPVKPVSGAPAQPKVNAPAPAQAPQVKDDSQKK
ncbi:MAG: DUF4349 domain-containing protein [Oscillospiraceae bacterium]|nr:DUF4349 domain-containing protein [Oscillospiraceae bacterium]